MAVSVPVSYTITILTALHAGVKVTGEPTVEYVFTYYFEACHGNKILGFSY